MSMYARTVSFMKLRFHQYTKLCANLMYGFRENTSSLSLTIYPNWYNCQVFKIRRRRRGREGGRRGGGERRSPGKQEGEGFKKISYEWSSTPLTSLIGSIHRRWSQVNLHQVGRYLRMYKYEGQNRHYELGHYENKHVDVKEEIPHGVVRRTEGVRIVPRPTGA
jgi:hypothetical protein